MWLVFYMESVTWRVLVRNEKRGTSIFILIKMFLNRMNIKELLDSEWSSEIQGKKLLENVFEAKDQATKGLSKDMNNQESIDVLNELEDPEEELHVTNGGKNRKRRNLIIDDEELSVEDTNKFKKYQ